MFPFMRFYTFTLTLTASNYDIQTELDRLRRENAQLRARLGLSPPPEEIILVSSEAKFDDSGINSPPMSNSGSPPAESVV